MESNLRFDPQRRPGGPWTGCLPQYGIYKIWIAIPAVREVNGTAKRNFSFVMKIALHFSVWTTLQLVIMTQGAFGQLTSTWTGADPSGYWSAPANWSPAGVPVNGADLVFPGGLPPE